MTPIFLSPFLLFILELMAGKHYLVLFGGSSSVWITLVLFFTISLLLGYLYATYTKPKIHITLLFSVTSIYILYHLLTSGSLFPFNFSFSSPVLTILLNTSANMLPFVIILSSATSLLPMWSHHTNPYRYYSLSNLGSLAGLLSYPILIEPYIPFRYQQIIWLSLFLINAWLIARTSTNEVQKFSKQPTHPSLSFAPIFYSTLSTAYFLITSTAISQAIGPFPLLWALPMAIYLLSFIIAFTYHQNILFSFHLPVTLFFLLITMAVSTGRLFLGSTLQFLWYLFTQLLVNVVFHTKLYRLRPPKHELPSFYVSIALGGAVASVLTGVVAPIIFSEFHEFPILIGLCILAFIIIAFQVFSKKAISIQFIAICLLGLTGMWYAYTHTLSPQQGYTVTQTKSRSFYGFLNLTEVATNNQVVERRLFSGQTIHGSQFYNNSKAEQEPTMYYSKNTALGLLFSKPVKNIGVIGLGVGTVAAYCQPGTNIVFYEINRDVIDIATQKFSYLKNCTNRTGSVNIVEGDARISLAKEAKRSYDILIVDAFTDDAIPIHLLTKEALVVYLSHLTDDGIIALHISSKYLNLKPTMVITATTLNLHISSHNTAGASYLLLSRAPLFVGNQETASMYRNLRPWTDDFTNIFQAIKW